MRSVIVGLVMSVLLGACTSIGTVDRNVAAPTGDEILFILGVTPDDHRVQVRAGSVEYGVFKPKDFSVVKLYATPTDGYVMWKGAASETAAVTMVVVVKDKSDVLGLQFLPCGDMRTMVFQGPAGKVVYLGDVAYRFERNRLSVTYKENFNAVQTFVELNYPQLKGQLSKGSYELLPTTQPCRSRLPVTPFYYR